MTKEELRRYRDMKAESRQITEQIQVIDSELYSVRGADLNGMPKGSAGSNLRTESLIDRKNKLKEYYQKLDAELFEEQYKIEKAIEGLSSRERRLMRHYYIEGLTWEQVCDVMHYSWTQIHRIHGEALKKLK